MFSSVSYHVQCAGVEQKQWKHVREGYKELLKEAVVVCPLCESSGPLQAAECSFSVCTDKAADLTYTQRHSTHWKDNESFMIFICLSVRLVNWTSRYWLNREFLNGEKRCYLSPFVLFCAAANTIPLYAFVMNENLRKLLVTDPCFHGLYIKLSNHSPTLWLSLCVCVCVCACRRVY